MTSDAIWHATNQAPVVNLQPLFSYAVQGLPVPQGDLAVGGRGRLYHKNKALEPWRHQVAWRARKAMRANGLGSDLQQGPISVSLIFILARPKTTPKTKATPPAVKKPDLDKLTRAIFDALTNVALVDDSQIVHVESIKRLAEVNEETGVIIYVDRVIMFGDWIWSEGQ